MSADASANTLGQSALLQPNSTVIVHSTKKHSLEYYHCKIWLYYYLPLLYIIAPCLQPKLVDFQNLLYNSTNFIEVSVLVSVRCKYTYMEGDETSCILLEQLIILSPQSPQQQTKLHLRM